MATEVTTELFKNKVLEDDKPAVVEVYTESCPNCRVLNPIFDQASTDNSDRYNFFRLNARVNMDIAKQYKVLGVPTLLFFSHGKLVDRKTGVINQQKIEKRLLPLLDYSNEIAIKKEIKGFFKLPWK